MVWNNWHQPIVWKQQKKLIKIIGLIQVLFLKNWSSFTIFHIDIFLEPYKLGVALFVIKPDLIANGKKDKILDHVNNQTKI